MPIISVPRLLMALVSWAILIAGLWLLWDFAQGREALDAHGVLVRLHPDRWRAGLGGGLIAWSFLGRFVVLMLMPEGGGEADRAPGRRIDGPEGANLQVETAGSAGPVLVMTHGWGLNASVWARMRGLLQDRFRVVTWDLPGLGRSSQPAHGRLSIDLFALALGRVVEAAPEGPVILIGHSIGGMTTQTFWRACPQAVRARVRGIVLVDTTHENPLKTMIASGLWQALRRTLIEPMCWLTILTWPLVWLSAWQSYLSGSSHLVMRLTGFGRHARRGDVDLAARLSAKGSPAVQAKGNLAMFRWRITEDLPAIPVPVLLLVGDKDIVTLPRASDEIAALARDARVKRVEGCGHLGFLERCDAYGAAIAAFAERVTREAEPRPRLQAVGG